jgi:hypothetical protein
MNSTSNNPAGLKWILWWVFVNVVSFAAGIALSQVIISVTGEIISFAVFGAVVGLVQWLTLRKHFSLTSASVGLILVNFVQRVVPWGEYSLILGILFCGLVIGSIQAYFLRNHLPKTFFWVLANVIGWLLGGVVGFYLDPQLSTFFVITINYSLIGIITGIFTGLFLIIRFKILEPVPNQKNFLFKSLITAIVILSLISIPLLWIQNSFDQIDLTKMPELGKITTCSELPPMECIGDQDYCSEIIPFEPVEGPGYINTPENGETWENQYRSYLRRDLKILVQYAAAGVACETSNWNYRELEPITLLDMSESDGAIPGTSVGDPGHPLGTHVDGTDIDISYFQVEKPALFPWLEGNSPRAVCKHTIFGVDAYHCTQSPQLLDPWRTALFIAYLSQHPQTRVIGVDGQIGLVLETALDQLVQAGWIDSGLRDQIPLAYELEYEGIVGSSTITTICISACSQNNC